MEFSREEMIATKINLLKNMHQHIIDLGDEDFYDWWIRDAVPDCPDDDIYRFIATHEESWLNCCNTFYLILKGAGEVQ